MYIIKLNVHLWIKINKTSCESSFRAICLTGPDTTNTFSYSLLLARLCWYFTQEYTDFWKIALVTTFFISFQIMNRKRCKFGILLKGNTLTVFNVEIILFRECARTLPGLQGIAIVFSVFFNNFFKWRFSKNVQKFVEAWALIKFLLKNRSSHWKATQKAFKLFLFELSVIKIVRDVSFEKHMYILKKIPPPWKRSQCHSKWLNAGLQPTGSMGILYMESRKHYYRQTNKK